MWEDPANMRGGKWTFTLSNKHHTARPELCDRLWLNLAMAVVGEQFREDVCGIVVSRRNRGDRLSVWTSNALDRQKVERLREEIIKFADMGGENLPMDFATHEAALATTPK
ncbi:MAG: translation initiation factor eIF 4e-like domain-containing protein [Olpidium bornovanus]|uniref:Translation initiation factor eIF 4e-like domain-containing protein n=1 Tax=Olpidium bornovanus TaxID=278681 RepID=A0A8H8DL71_9FUNG|nr:MAG: translation initiation factor eIF 4e-like domain-containing protein [Olpidium bornovanus]